MYTRQQLIDLCREAKVLYNDWSNRDSFSAQQNVLMAGLLLESGCEFKVLTKENAEGSGCVTDDNTVWIEISYDDWEDGERWHTHYIPTQKRLNDNRGRDWY